MNSKYKYDFTDDFSDDITGLTAKRANEPTLYVLLLLDKSGSMHGTPIQNLSQAVNSFREELCQDPKAADIVETCIMTFNDQVQLVQDWCPVTEMAPVDLTAGGNTNISAAVEAALAKIHQATYAHESEIGPVRMPYLILLTDGAGGDVSKVAAKVQQRQNDRKLQMWCLGIKSPAYDEQTLTTLTGGPRVFELPDDGRFDFTPFFDLTALLIKTASVSVPGEDVVLDDRAAEPLRKLDIVNIMMKI